MFEGYKREMPGLRLVLGAFCFLLALLNAAFIATTESYWSCGFSFFAMMVCLFIGVYHLLRAAVGEPPEKTREEPCSHQEMPLGANDVFALADGRHAEWCTWCGAWRIDEPGREWHLPGLEVRRRQ